MAVARTVIDIASRQSLTERERACLRLLADGASDDAIAAQLGISARTVRFHVDNAKQTLKAKNRVHLIALALRAKALDP